jgi:hypothetical protein
MDSATGYQTEATVQPDGSLTLRSLPFGAGQRVQVLVLPAGDGDGPANGYPLRGTPYRYDDPTLPVADFI